MCQKRSLLNGHHCQVWGKLCSPLPVMVTSPKEWKILECNNKPKKRTKAVQFRTSVHLISSTMNWLFKLEMYWKVSLSIWLLTQSKLRLITDDPQSLSSDCCYNSFRSLRWRSELEWSPRKRKVGCSNPSRDRTKSLKQIVTAPLPNARH